MAIVPTTSEIIVELTTPDGVIQIPDPRQFSSEEWSDNINLWPCVTVKDIKVYLLETPAIDGLPTAAHLSLEAVDLLLSGWVGMLLATKKGDIVYLKGKVSRSQSTTEADHDTWVCCKVSGAVLVGFCTCMAGLGKACSHVSAILFKVEEGYRLQSKPSCTDMAMSWNKSTKRNAVPEKIKNLKKKRYFTGEETECAISPTKRYTQFYDHDEMCNSLKSSAYSKLFTLSGTLWETVLNAPEADNCIEEVQIVHLSHSELSFDLPVTSLACEPCSKFYNTYVKVTLLQIEMLNKETKAQHTDELWMDSRRVRLTASTSSKCPKKSTTNADKFLKAHVFCTFKGNKNTDYGIKHEPVAIKSFENIYSFEVRRSGTVVDEVECWLSASPDGLIGEDSILEVKCPVRNLEELVSSNKYDVRKNKEGELYLCEKGPNGYYLQVQLTLHCTKRTTCYFFVWGVSQSVMVVVPYNHSFVKKELQRLRDFYFKLFLPYLCAKFNDGKILFGRKFLKLMGVSINK